MRVSITVHRLFLTMSALVAAAVFSISCSKTYKDIDVKDVRLENMRLSSLRSVDAVMAVEIENPAVQRFKAENIKGTIYRKSEQVATFSSDDVIKLEPKSVSESKITVRVTLDNPLNFIESLAKDRGLKFGDYTIDIQADVSSGLVKVTYKKKGLDVKSMMEKEL